MTDVREVTVSESISREERVIASKLFRVRTRMGIEREGLAQMVGIEEQTLAEYENGIQAIPASDLFMLATAIGISMEYFYSEDAVSYASYCSEGETALLS